MQRHAHTFPKESLLGRINDASWHALSSRWTVHSFSTRSYLITADDRNNRDVFFILDGSVRATVYTDTGREVSLLSFGRGDCIGEFSAIDDAPRSSDAITTRDSLIAQLSAPEFKMLLREHADIGPIPDAHTPVDIQENRNWGVEEAKVPTELLSGPKYGRDRNPCVRNWSASTSQHRQRNRKLPPSRFGKPIGRADADRRPDLSYEGSCAQRRVTGCAASHWFWGCDIPTEACRVQRHP